MKEELKSIVGREVDLVEHGAIAIRSGVSLFFHPNYIDNTTFNLLFAIFCAIV
jgi:hypothetical protein